MRNDSLDAEGAVGVVLDEMTDRPVYLVDAYGGGIVPWDWTGVRGGGLWYELLWPLVIETALARLKEDPGSRLALVLDGYTLERMAEGAPDAVERLREAVASERLELVNGTYASPLSVGASGEANIRQLYFGLAAMAAAAGRTATSFVATQPQFFPQLPQLLAGFGFTGAILRAHGGVLGGDAAEDASIVRWIGPDGSVLLGAPRYGFMDYGRDGEEDAVAALLGHDLHRWDNGQLAGFKAEAEVRGIRYPLISRVAEAKAPEAPFARVRAIAARSDIRPVTPREYLELAGDGPRDVMDYADDIHCFMPWGLGGGRLQRDIVEAEGNLLLAERLDALAYAMGKNSEEAKLETAWKQLLLAQHGELTLCGHWLSQRHGKPLAEVGGETAQAARRAAGEVAQAAAGYLAAQVDSSAVEGRALVIFNPSSWARREYVEFTLHGAAPRVFQGGKEIPAQVVRRSGELTTVGFVVSLPAAGYRLYDLRFGAGPEGVSESQEVSETWSGEGEGHHHFAGTYYSADIRPNATVRLEAAGSPVMEGGYLTVWRDGEWHDLRDCVAEPELAQQGPVFDRYRAEGTAGGIKFCHWITLYRSLPRVDLRVEFDFGEGVAFGPQLADHTPDTPYYAQDDRKLCLNFTSQHSMAIADSPFLLSEAGGERITGLGLVGLEDGLGSGVAILNRGTPGHYLDRERGVLRTVLAWAPERWTYRRGDWMGRAKRGSTRLSGGYAYECALVPFASRLKAMQAGIDYQLPCLGVLLGARAGRLPPEGSFISVGPESIVLSALFVHQQGVYARLWNASSESRTATFASGGPLSLWKCSLDLTPREHADSIELRPWGVQTLSLRGPGE